jgi:hypothetical protein
MLATYLNAHVAHDLVDRLAGPLPDPDWDPAHQADRMPVTSSSAPGRRPPLAKDSRHSELVVDAHKPTKDVGGGIEGGAVVLHEGGL